MPLRCAVFSEVISVLAIVLPISVILVCSESISVSEVRLYIDRFCMACCEHDFVDHDVGAAGIDPDLSQGPLVLVVSSFIVFEIDGFDVS